MLTQKGLESLLDDERVIGFGVMKSADMIVVNFEGAPQRTYNTEESMMEELYYNVAEISEEEDDPLD